MAWPARACRPGAAIPPASSLAGLACARVSNAAPRWRIDTAWAHPGRASLAGGRKRSKPWPPGAAEFAPPGAHLWRVASRLDAWPASRPAALHGRPWALPLGRGRRQHLAHATACLTAGGCCRMWPAHPAHDLALAPAGRIMASAGRGHRGAGGRPGHEKTGGFAGRPWRVIQQGMERYSSFHCNRERLVGPPAWPRAGAQGLRGLLAEVAPHRQASSRGRRHWMTWPLGPGRSDTAGSLAAGARAGFKPRRPACARASDAAGGACALMAAALPPRGRIRAGGQPSHLAGFVNSRGG